MRVELELGAAPSVGAGDFDGVGACDDVDLSAEALARAARRFDFEVMAHARASGACSSYAFRDGAAVHAFKNDGRQVVVFFYDEADLWPRPEWRTAAVTFGISTPSTTNNSDYTTASFTPAVNDVLFVFTVVTGSTDNGSVSDSQGGTYSRVDLTTTKNASADRLNAWVRNTRVTSAVATTVTWARTGGAGSTTGGIVDVDRWSSMTRTSLSAVRQSTNQSNQAAAGTPTHTFGVACLTGNATTCYVANGTNPGNVTATASWTRNHNNGYNTPATGACIQSRNSGFTGTSIAWGGTSASAFGSIGLEIDATNPSIDEDFPPANLPKTSEPWVTWSASWPIPGREDEAPQIPPPFTPEEERVTPLPSASAPWVTDPRAVTWLLDEQTPELTGTPDENEVYPSTLPRTSSTWTTDPRANMWRGLDDEQTPELTGTPDENEVYPSTLPRTSSTWTNLPLLHWPDEVFSDTPAVPLAPDEDHLAPGTTPPWPTTWTSNPRAIALAMGLDDEQTPELTGTPDENEVYPSTLPTSSASWTADPRAIALALALEDEQTPALTGTPDENEVYPATLPRASAPWTSSTAAVLPEWRHDEQTSELFAPPYEEHDAAWTKPPFPTQWRVDFRAVLAWQYDEQIIFPIPVVRGTTRECATGAVLPNCTVRVYRTSSGALVGSTVSDGAGAFAVVVDSFVDTYFIVAHDAAGTLAGASADDVLAEVL